MSNTDSVSQSTAYGAMKSPPSDFIVMPLDPSLYKLEDDAAAFFKQVTGIHDDEELKQHILRVQTEAYNVWIPHHSAKRFGVGCTD